MPDNSGLKSKVSSGAPEGTGLVILQTGYLKKLKRNLGFA